MEIRPLYLKEDACPAPAAVRVPQVDDLAADQLAVNAPLHLVDFQQPQQHSLHHQAKYLKSVASDLTFSKDVVKQRGLQSLPFHEWNAREIYDASNILPDITKRHTVKPSLKTDPPKHQLCQLKYASPRIKKGPVRSSLCLGESLFRPVVSKSQTSISTADEALVPRTFDTEVPEADPASSQIDKSMSDNLMTAIQGGWEEGVLKQLTKNTAQWIVSQQVSHGYHRDQVCLRYGLCRSQDLISEECFVQRDFMTIEELEEADRKHIPCLVKKKELDIPLAVYYRVPSYCPPKTIDDELGSQNLTTDIVPVVHFEPPPPLRLQDMMNPRAGKYRYFSVNPFEHELYSGSARIVHRRGDSQNDRILMDSLNEYNKHLQEAFPRTPEYWSFLETGKRHTPKKRALRWRSLPTAIDNQAEVRPSRGVAKVKPEVHAKKDSLTQDLRLIKNMLDGWKEAWLLSVRWHDATLAQLKRGLVSMHDDDKVIAIAICASAALERPKQEGSLRDLGICTYKEGSSPDVPEELMVLITEALKDQNERVRMAAAILHFTIRAENEEARKVLYHALEHGNNADSWAAAQCLAIDGNDTFPVLTRLLTQLTEVENKETEEQVCMLLTQLSEGTSLIHSLLADRLNSSSWMDRNVACRALSHLHGHTSQDLRNKLVQIMWDDWSGTVRRAAAQALGRMGLGIMVHNQLREKLEQGDSRTRVEALCVIGWLRLMTAKLLPGFLQCFSDEFVTVRCEACHAAGALQLKDPMVLERLIKLIQSDPIWKIKAFAIRAVGQIGQSSTEVKELLLWAIHYEEEPVVRVQACRTIAILQLRDPDVQSILQDRLLLDPSEQVKRAAIRALRAMDISPDVSQNSMQMIKNQLHRLCQKDVVIYKIMKLDKIKNRDRQRTHKLILDDYDKEPERKPCRVGKTLSEGSRTLTQLTLVSEEELEALMDHSAGQPQKVLRHHKKQAARKRRHMIGPNNSQGATVNPCGSSTAFGQRLKSRRLIKIL